MDSRPEKLNHNQTPTATYGDGLLEQVRLMKRDSSGTSLRGMRQLLLGMRRKQLVILQDIDAALAELDHEDPADKENASPLDKLVLRLNQAISPNEEPEPVRRSSVDLEDGLSVASIEYLRKNGLMSQSKGGKPSRHATDIRFQRILD